VRACEWVLLGAARAPSPDVRCGLRPSLTPRRRRFAILAALASEAGSRDTGSPSLSSKPTASLDPRQDAAAVGMPS